MRRNKCMYRPLLLVLMMAAWCTLSSESPAPIDLPVAAPTAVQPPPPPAQELPEVLTRGPVHEAFAQPVDVQVQAGLVVHKQPPASIREIPPADRPAGDHYVWVPGYWSWDADRNDFIWVSGCWRVAPPSMNWVPGYWATANNGWEWVAGFWSAAEAKEIRYLPPPPPAEDIDPPGPSPDEADMWVPGCWYWNDEQYVLRHGYWLHQQPGWVWVPSHYCWTPRGYAFAAGHWDYTLEQRGVLFAPVCFSAGTPVSPDYVYSPEVCLDVGLLTDCLFAYPCYSHYFFGDYYDSFYFGCGIYPWFASVNFHTWCCPTFAYCRWQGCLRDRDWERNVHHTFDERCVDRSLRPSRTLLEQNQRVAALAPADRGNWQLGKPLYNVAAAGAGKFSRIDLSARNEIARQANEVHAFRAARTRWEQPSAASEAGGRAGATTVPAAHGAAAPAAHVAEGRGPADWTPQHAAPTASPATAPVERRASATWFTPRSAPVTPFAPAPQAYHEFRPTYEPPREVHVSQPERVSLPSASYWGRSSGSVSIERTPPSHPAYEHASGSANQRRDR